MEQKERTFDITSEIPGVNGITSFVLAFFDGETVDDASENDGGSGNDGEGSHNEQQIRWWEEGGEGERGRREEGSPAEQRVLIPFSSLTGYAKPGVTSVPFRK